MNWTLDRCPISDEAAQEALPRVGDFVEIICQSCGRFRISGSALETARHLDKKHKLEILNEAKRVTRDGKIPYIQNL